MDRYDRQLLTLLQADSRLTSDQLSERLHLSPSAITRRIQRMRADGTIAAEVAVLGERFHANRVTAVVNIQLDRHQPAQADELRRFLRTGPEIQLVCEISGAADVMIIASVRDMNHFNSFADRLASMPLVRRYETQFVKRMIKFSTAVPLDDDQTPGTG